MSLARFNIIVAIDKDGGISRDGELPWDSPEDMNFFKSTTTGNGKNVVIMGRLTYESIPGKFRPLRKRKNVVISSSIEPASEPLISVYPSILEALKGLGNQNGYDEIFIMGGGRIYDDILENYLYLCDKIYLTKFKASYQCDMAIDNQKIESLPLALDVVKSNDYNRFVFSPSIKHEEYQYLKALKNTVNSGDVKPDRTGVGTLSTFGVNFKFDIRDRIPILTTKQVWIEGIIKELLFFISGKTDTKILENQGVNIWKGNTSKTYLEKIGLNYDEGVMGPCYPHQLRHYGASYFGPNENYENKGIDQLQNVIDQIKSDPHSRRLIISYWNPNQLKEMALPPCHIIVQFNVVFDNSNLNKYLDCSVYQRSMDAFLGGPFNIASYSILTHMIAFITDLKPRNLIYNIGDFHIYKNHIEQVKKQITRTPRPFPKLTFRRQDEIKKIDDFTLDDFMIEGYEACGKIKADMNA
jgi:dihydrofolate reductase/thymidylate synthase